MNKIILSLVFTAAFFLAGPMARAQSTFSFAGIGATNSPNDLATFSSEISNGALVSTSANESFTGLDGNEDSQTMNLTATASAQSTYGRLRGRVEGMLTNSYYNINNPPYFDGSEVNPDGSPDQFGVFAFADFTEHLQFGGTLQAGYRARYQFFISGSASGLNLASLSVTIAGNPTEDFTVDSSGGDGPVGQYFTTETYPIDGNFQQTIEVSFTTQFNPVTQGNDGLNISGLGDFSSTATLTAVLLFDANDNLVSNYSVGGASGTTYSASGVRLDAITKNENGILLQGVGVPDAEHRILATESLAQPFDPTPIGSVTADMNGIFQFTDPTSLSQRFYRVVYP